MVSKDSIPRRPAPPTRLRRPRLTSISRATSRMSALALGSALRRQSLDRGLRAPRPNRFRLNALDRGAGAGRDHGRGCLAKILSACCCCCGCCCCCLNLQYAQTRPGALRISQLILSWLCNWLLGRYALRVAGTLGNAMPAFFLTSAAGAVCCSLLLAVSLLSERSLGLLRASLFEVFFHATAVGLYASQASLMHVATTIYLEPFKDDVESYTYPAVVSSYWTGYFLAALHALDVVYSLKHYRQYRN